MLCGLPECQSKSHMSCSGTTGLLFFTLTVKRRGLGHMLVRLRGGRAGQFLCLIR